MFWFHEKNRKAFVQARNPISAETEVIEMKNTLHAMDFSREINWSQTDWIRFHEVFFYYFLQVLLNVTGSTECIDDIAANHVLVNILHVLYTLPEHRVVALDLLYAVAGDTRLVKESLQFGKFFLFNYYHIKLRH